jgi:hypothetical protein
LRLKSFLGWLAAFPSLPSFASVLDPLSLCRL